jgi:hypothetical protein
MTDWRKILVAYMAHVIGEESISFLGSTHLDSTSFKILNDAEREALFALEEEAREAMRNEARRNLIPAP